MSIPTQVTSIDINDKKYINIDRKHNTIHKICITLVYTRNTCLGSQTTLLSDSYSP